MFCPKCGNRMKWEPYTLVNRPDALRKSDGRAPIEWAWHCRCGMWIYHRKPCVRLGPPA